MPVSRTGFLLLAGAMILPTAVADDRHAFDVRGGTLTLPPAPEAYILREGAYVEVPRSLLLDPDTHAILRVGDKIVGEGNAPGHLLGGTAATRITFDNPDTRVPRRGVVSIEITPAVGSGLLSGLLRGGSGTSRFVYFAAEPEPDPAPASPPTPVVPTPSPPAPTPPPPASVPTPIPTPSATPSADTSAPPTTAGPTSADTNGAAMSAAFRGLLPSIPLWSALKVALLAAGAVGVLAVVRLGRP